MLERLVALVAAVTFACAPTAQPGPTPSAIASASASSTATPPTNARVDDAGSRSPESPPAPPADWWLARPIAGAERSAAAFRGRPDELVFVDTRNVVRFRPAELTHADAGRWEWRLEPGPPELSCVLKTISATSGTLQCSDGSHEEAFSLTRIEPGARARELQQLEQAQRPPKNVCEVTKACCIKAFPVLAPGKSCNPDVELGKPPLPDNCQRVIRGLRELLQARNAPIPSECAL